MVGMYGIKYLCTRKPLWSSWLSTGVQYCGCACEVKSSILDIVLFYIYYIMTTTVTNWTPCTWKFLLESYWTPCTGLHYTHSSEICNFL